MRIILLFTAFFLFTLWGYKPMIRMAGVIPLLMYLLFFVDQVRLDQRLIKFIVALIVILIGYAFYYYAFGQPIATAESWLAFPNNIIALSIMILIALVISCVVSDPYAQEVMPGLFKWLLIAHILPFAVQFVSVYGVGYYPDFYMMLTGKESRYLEYAGSTLVGSFGLYRSTGWSVEPSNYSANMAILVTVYLYLTGLKLNKVSFAALLTIPLTFSSAAYIEFLLIVSALLIQSLRRSAGITLSGMMVLVVVFFMAGGERYLETITGRYQMTAGSRIDLASIPFEREGELMVFGPGPFGIEKEYWYDTQGSGEQRTLASVNDSGFPVFLLLCFGMMGFVVCFMLYKWLVIDVASFLMLTSVLLSKVSFYQPTFYFFVVLFFYATRLYAEQQRAVEVAEYDDDPDSPDDRALRLRPLNQS